MALLTVGNLVRLLLLCLALYMSVRIRLFAVIRYGRVIHEFDPWFNYRATEYMVANGWDKFQAWYDDQVWYPLGRHVGSTTYPGLQLTAWAIYEAIGKAAEALPEYASKVSLNDVCVFLPAGFGLLATSFTGLIAYEATNDPNAGVMSAFFMAVLPAHLMRSVAGGYDNESIAITAIVATFYLWIRSLRTSSSWPWAILAGLAYVYMVAAWGGYVFVLNMIGVHAAVLVAFGRFSPNLHKAYTIWYVLGTIGALTGPARYLVGWQPFQSMEQLGPLGILIGLQLLQICKSIRMRAKTPMSDEEYFMLVVKAFSVAIAVAAILVALVLPSGFVGPLSARVRGLFIKHTKTGNPLVDSVAEHQATPPTVYMQYYHFLFLLGPAGFICACLRLLTAEEPPSTPPDTSTPDAVKLAVVAAKKRREDGRVDALLFVLTYSIIAAYFSMKMIRLVLILSPGACVCGGIFLATAVSVTSGAWAELDSLEPPGSGGGPQGGKGGGAAVAAGRGGGGGGGRSGGGGGAGGRGGGGRDRGGRDGGNARRRPPADPNEPPSMAEEFESLREMWDESPDTRMTCGAGALVLAALGILGRFLPHCWYIAPHLSEPQIIVRGKPDPTSGERPIIDDFREAYWWLRDETPEDSRVMAWWDYGYQINGVGNRTTIADGNTWNHEHIALLGKCLTSPEKESHEIVKHLADYVLLWTTRHAGMYADDLAKSPHMARIGSSVYGDRIGCDVKEFYMEKDGTPSECMRASILWRMHAWRFDTSAEELELFEEAYTTTNRMVRIYKVRHISQESKDWRAAKGVECASAECYPPALAKTLELKQSFRQIHGLG